MVLTIWVAHTLFTHGRRFLVDVFSDESLADSVNHLLVVGFYLFNLGYIALQLQVTNPPDAPGVVEALATKVGLVLMVLAVLHFGNLIAFNAWRRRTLAPSPPTAPPVVYYGPPQFPPAAPATPAPGAR